MDCNDMIFTERWLHSGIPDNPIELVGCHTLRMDRIAGDSSTMRWRIVNVNKAWCTKTVIIGKHCYADFEYLMVKCRYC